MRLRAPRPIQARSKLASLKLRSSPNGPTTSSSWSGRTREGSRSFKDPSLQIPAHVSIFYFSSSTFSAMFLALEIKLEVQAKLQHLIRSITDLNNFKAFKPTLLSKFTESIFFLRTKLRLEKLSLSEAIRDTFYQLMNFPLRSVCLVGKFFGGQWISGYGCIDGHKYVCLDNFYPDVKSGRCLVYSYGISDDWTFEEAAASMGCRQDYYLLLTINDLHLGANGSTGL